MKDALKIIGLVLLVVGGSALFAYPIYRHNAPPKKPIEVHLEAIDEFHRAMHKGGLPHPWFHPSPRVSPTKGGSRL